MEKYFKTLNDKFIDGIINKKVKVKIPFSIFKKGGIKKLIDGLKKKINL